MQQDLSTTETDGARKWVFPTVISGAWWARRRIVAWLLIAWLLIAPWIQVGGHQAVFFDLSSRHIHFLGLSFWMNELVVVMFFLLFVISSILLLTALMGRVFCGWACPITVFMEFVFRPIERLIEGSGAVQKAFKAKPLSEKLPRLSLKWILFIFFSVVLGNTFVAYLMGSHRLIEMLQEGPLNHWGPFIFMLASSAVILFQYGWFREQICLFVCPYGRLQSVMLDRDSLIVAYDVNRGEPRGKLGSTKGDCVDCKLCVRVCPTGIDIRKGLQLECVHCTACVDACDSIMQKVGKPLGLIRYQTENEVEKQPGKILRPRLAVYALVVAIASAFLVGYTSSRMDFEVTLHRESGHDLFSTDSEQNVVNEIKVNVQNLIEKDLQIKFLAVEPASLIVISPIGDLNLGPLGKEGLHLILKLPKEAFRGKLGLLPVKFKAVSQMGSEIELEMKAVGPANQ